MTHLLQLMSMLAIAVLKPLTNMEKAIILQAMRSKAIKLDEVT
ncbi:hypothetical protein [Nostoc sp.]